MNLSQQQFEQFLSKNQLVLSLIGMSNIGKTFWSKKLSDIGFTHHNCDDRIEELLSPLLNDLGYSGIADVSKWMGQPYDQQFSERQMKYLFFEEEVLENIFDKIENGTEENMIIDTTGSVIHTRRGLCERLNRLSVVVYLESSEEMKEEMFQKYLKEPKPVVFGNIYSSKENESQTESLGRCYKELLELRSTLYKEHADIVIPFEKNNHDLNAAEFISLIKEHHEIS